MASTDKSSGYVEWAWSPELNSQNRIAWKLSGKLAWSTQCSRNKGRPAFTQWKVRNNSWKLSCDFHMGTVVLTKDIIGKVFLNLVHMFLGKSLSISRHTWIPNEVPWDGRALEDIGVIAIQECINLLLLTVHHRETMISIFSYLKDCYL